MHLCVEKDCKGVDWQTVADILKCVGMAYYAPELHARAFASSYATVFIYDEDRLIGFGRAISDGAYQAAVYDCAVLPEYQGKRIGTMIMRSIMDSVAGCNVILYAAPGKEGFYQKQGFGKMKTGMAKFLSNDAMRKKGFIE